VSGGAGGMKLTVPWGVRGRRLEVPAGHEAESALHMEGITALNRRRGMEVERWM